MKTAILYKVSYKDENDKIIELDVVANNVFDAINTVNNLFHEKHPDDVKWPNVISIVEVKHVYCYKYL